MAEAMCMSTFHFGKFKDASQCSRHTTDKTPSGAVSAPKEIPRLPLCPFRLGRSIEDVTKHWRDRQEDRFPVLHSMEINAAVSHAIAGERCHIANAESGVAQQEHHGSGSTPFIRTFPQVVTGGENSHNFFLRVWLLRFCLDLWRIHFLGGIREHPFSPNTKAQEVTQDGKFFSPRHCRNRPFRAKKIDRLDFHIVEFGDPERFSDSKKVVERSAMVAFCAMADVFLRRFECLNGILYRLRFPVFWAFQYGEFPVCLVKTSGIEGPAIAFPLQCSIHSQAAFAVEKLLPFLTVGAFS